MQPVKNCIGPTIRIGQEILCIPYAGFFWYTVHSTKQNYITKLGVVNICIDIMKTCSDYYTLKIQTF